MNDLGRLEDLPADYVAELQRLYARYREIEARKRPLIERLADIGAAR